MANRALDDSVLIVEDDEDIREAVRDLVMAQGERAITMGGGRAALSYLFGAKRLPRLIVLDLMLPEVDGWTFRRIQQIDPELARIPVIVITAAEDGVPEDVPVLKKPLSLGGLLEQLRPPSGSAS